MVKNILVIIAFIVCLGLYFFFTKNESKETSTVDEHTKQPLETKKTVTKVAPPVQKQVEKQHSKLPKVSEPKNTIPAVNLKYYNLSLEKDYNNIYKNEKENDPDLKYPPLLKKEDTQEQSDLNFNLTPEINYNQETKEITIDGLQIQVEKKF